MRVRFFLGFLLLALPNISFSQFSVTGYILDAISNEPLQGVSIFYDGTTIGTITDENGFFKMETPKLMTTNLVISYIGYETRVLEGSKTGFLENILLKEEVFRLDEVVLRPDTWSREKKLAIFRREFLGKTSASLKCKILNEDDIRLYYNKDENKLYAYAVKPIRVKNDFLGYRLTYGLHDFEVLFQNTLSGLRLPYSTYMAGIVFFSELNAKKLKKKHAKRREELYSGSILHFMRALSKKHLVEEGFKIFKDKFQVEPYSEFYIKKANPLTEISQNTEKLSILYKNIEQSSIEIEGTTFYIDEYGNHSPPDRILFGGEMGKSRVGDLLPLDYGTTVLEGMESN
ncbi:carboxypeptidase-like regulatory domain-containing protein [Maribacter sp. 2304DJ31-5]|uniref:carboxypeptidase-like regulatory domain-containing protein n=1 Tax=Maribacter sp. 2304DJ31-5 TaxID=3386273 RepID=UPI0039BD293D